MVLMHDYNKMLTYLRGELIFQYILSPGIYLLLYSGLALS